MAIHFNNIFFSRYFTPYQIRGCLFSVLQCTISFYSQIKCKKKIINRNAQKQVRGY